MNREVCKFFSGSFAALAYAHGAYAVATSRGIINEPVFLGRRWGVGFMWTEVAIYSALSLGLGYLGWRAAAPEQRSPAVAGQGSPSLNAAEQPQPVSG